MNNFKRINTILGWFTFVIALVVYVLTLEPSVSLWDCGEFISASYRLQVVHPPGAPLFLMLGRVFSIFAEPGTNEVAIAVNMLSAVASAATVMFTFWITTHFAKKITGEGINVEKPSLGNAIAIIGAGLVAALSVTFMDSFWFSAVEAEVYAASSCFMALAFWAILKWEGVKHEETADRWIVFIAYVIGLGIGLHLLNLLVIPAILFYYFFNKYEVTKWNLFKAAAIGLGSIAFLQWIVIPKTPVMAANFDLFFVNSLGLPFNSGSVFLMLFIAVTIAIALMFTHRNKKTLGYVAAAMFGILILAAGSLSIGSLFIRLIVGGIILYGFNYMMKGSKPMANLILLCFAFIMLGFSSYSMVVIRSTAEPAIDMNDPQDAQSLLSYINREQYGERALIYGPYWNARLVAIDEGRKTYRRGDNEYEEIGTKPEYKFDPNYSTIFPRMGDNTEKSNYYPIWCGMEENFYRVSDLKNKAKADPGNREIAEQLAMAEMEKPTMKNNLTFLFKYQIGWMYWRYFMWNFAGRQNDLQNVTGNNQQGNWISGITPIDNSRLGPQDDLPKHLAYNKGRNVYYFLPLLLGILGVVVQYKKDKLDFYSVLVMFLFTGLLVVVYLNQPPMEPRERDYTNVGSFQTFCIWIGLGVLFIADLVKKYVNRATAATAATVIGLLGAPILMASQNWDDHDRSDRYLGISFAKNYLNSCAENAILFTNGDNDTYPLWYAQNVEGVRTDIRVINLSLLPTEWYSSALRRKVFDSEPLPLSIPAEKLVAGKREYIRYFDKNFNQKQFYPLHQVLDYMTSDDQSKQQRAQSDELVNIFPVKNFSVDVDKSAAIASGFIPTKDTAKIVDKLKWNIGRNGLSKGDMVVLDIISTNAKTGWKRPIYWTTTTGSSVYLNLDKYLRNNGLTYQLLPIEANSRMRGMDDMDLLYDRLMNTYEWGGMENGTLNLDDKAQLVPQNLRSMFVQIADYFANTNKLDSAVNLLDKCYSAMPETILPMNLRLKAASAEVYYKADEIEKGDKFLNEVGEDAAELVKYYGRFRSKGMQSVEGDKRENLEILRNIGPLAGKYERKELETKFTDLFKQYNVGY